MNQLDNGELECHGGHGERARSTAVLMLFRLNGGERRVSIMPLARPRVTQPKAHEKGGRW